MTDEQLTREEREILEEAGAYELSLSLVPKTWFQIQTDPELQANSYDPQKRRVWWIGYIPPISVSEYCDKLMVRGDCSQFDYGLVESTWVGEHHHRVVLWEVEPNSIADLDIHIDPRHPFSVFLTRIVGLANQLGCILYVEKERSFISPTVIGIYEALRRSAAGRLAEEGLN